MKDGKTYHTKGLFGSLIVHLKENGIETECANFKRIRRRFEDILLLDYFSISSECKTDYEISLYACQQLKLKPIIDPKLQRPINFYELYTPELIEPFEYRNEIKYEEFTHNQILQFTPYGLEIYELDRLRMIVKPDRMFFAGPYVSCLPLEQRIRIRNSIFKALGTQTVLTLNDAFPLIDYEALEQGAYSWEKDFGNTGSFLRLRKGFLHYGGWSSPRDGGAKSTDLEWCLHYGKDYFNFFTNRDFENEYDEIMKTITKHIIH